jgi:3-oxoacyl-[acyl-carrier-protein] synthase-3
VKVPYFAGKSPFSTLEPEAPYIRMSGKEIFRFAVQSMMQDITTLLQRNGLTEKELKIIIPHQANSAHHRGGGGAFGHPG